MTRRRSSTGASRGMIWVISKMTMRIMTIITKVMMMIRGSRGLVQLSPVQNVPVPILQRRFKGHSYWRWWWWPGERRSFYEFLLLNRCYNFSQSMGPNIVSHCNWKSFWRRLNRCQILIHCTDLCPLEYLCKLPRTFSNTATENHTELHISFFCFGDSSTSKYLHSSKSEVCNFWIM